MSRRNNEGMSAPATSKMVPGDDESTKSSSGGGLRIDGVFLLAILGVIVGIVALALEVSVYLLDEDWNKFMTGKMGLTDNHKKYFKGKTLYLKGSDNRDKAREAAMRTSPMEPVFCAIVALCLIIVLCHLCGCYIRRKGSSFCIMVVVYYGCGIGCLVACILLVVSANKIHENYEVSAGKLMKVQEEVKDEIETKNCTTKMERAERDECATLEYSNVLLGILEKIFRECHKVSGFSKYTMSGDERAAAKVDIAGEDFSYTRDELEDIGFCQKDDLKLWAAICAAIAAIIFFLIPCIYCLKGSSKNEAEVAPEAGKAPVPVPVPVPVPAPEEQKQEKRGSRSESFYLDQFRLAIMQETYSDTETDGEKPEPKPKCRPPPPKPQCPPPKPQCPPPRPQCPAPPPPSTPQCVNQAPQRKCPMYGEQPTIADGDYSCPARTQVDPCFKPPPAQSCPPPQRRTCPRCGCVPCRC